MNSMIDSQALVSSKATDVVWVLISAALVMLMQAGFCCLESGFCRAKNTINVAIKNLLDFCVSSLAYWAFGFALMFGASWGGWIGTTRFLVDADAGSWLLAFFLFQMVFCGTSTTIVSGAVAERTRFTSYLTMSLLISGLLYPVFGHWTWGGAFEGRPTGWLAQLGFIDFAGSTAVHSLGGWFALSAVLIVGPRLGRFSGGGAIPGHNIPLATFGAMLLWFGWFGFNGGSTLAANDHVALILVNTNLAAAAGSLSALTAAAWLEKRFSVDACINGAISGLVAVTAGCHVIRPGGAVMIGVIAGLLCVSAGLLLVRLQIDDAVGAIPVHGFCGAWGTLAVAIFGQVEGFGGQSRIVQFAVQLIGVLTCFGWAAGAGGLLLWLLNRVTPLRVDATSEQQGLNFSEHGASTELIDLLGRMNDHHRRSDFSERVPVEPHTEVGQIAAEYNRVLEHVEQQIVSQREAGEAVRAAEAKYRGLFENSVEGIFQTTLDGRFLSANPALARIYGYDSPEQLLRGMTDVGSQLYVDPQRRQQFCESIEEAGEVRGFESAIRRRDGTVIWISETARLVRDEAGQPLRFDGTVVEITDRIESRKLIQEKEAAEAASQAKSTFLARMSHEIRTPLNGVIGMLDLLVGTQLDQRQDRYVRVAKSSAAALLCQINDILDFSKIEAGKLELEHVPFSIRELMEEISEMFATRARANNIEVSCHVLPDVPRQLIGDPERVRQIVINFLNNAIKFTKHGEAAIRAELLAMELVDGLSVAQMRLSVRDTGIGMTLDQQRRLFKSFSQADVTVSRKYGGTGLGLAICKQLVELMGGTVGVESQPNEGSTFWCDIPFPIASLTEVAADTVSDGGRPLRLFALDDTPTNLEILRDQAQSWGFEITTSDDHSETLKTIRRAAKEGRPYDLILLDRQLPGADGLELAAEIHKERPFKSTPILLLTSLDSTMDPEMAEHAGLAGVLTKPIRQSRLLESILGAVRSNKNDSRPDRTSLSTTTADAEKFVVPVELLNTTRVLVADDNEINRLVTGEILSSVGFRHDVVCNGREVLSALTRERYDLVLMDCEMPEMDGWAATREIRRLEAAGTKFARRHLPIVALTANAVNGDRERCLAVGMDDYVTKPIDRHRLLTAVVQQLQGNDQTAAAAPPAATEEPVAVNVASSAPAADSIPARRKSSRKAVANSESDAAAAAAHPSGKKNTSRRLVTQESDASPPPTRRRASAKKAQTTTDQLDQILSTVQPEETSPPGPPSEAAVDWPGLLERCGGDQGFALKLINKFRTRCSADWEQLNAAISSGDLEATRRAAHALAGSAGNLSAIPVQRSAKALELAAIDGRTAAVKAAAKELRPLLDAFLEWIECKNASTPVNQEAAVSPSVVRMS